MASPDLSAAREELRRRKEAFVSGLPGTSKWEIFCILDCVPFFLLFGKLVHVITVRLGAAAC